LSACPVYREEVLRLELGQDCSLVLWGHFSLQVDFDEVCHHGCKLTQHLLVTPLFVSQDQEVFGASSVQLLFDPRLIAPLIFGSLWLVIVFLAGGEGVDEPFEELEVFDLLSVYIFEILLQVLDRP
jgi:hypothetical protein